VDAVFEFRANLQGTAFCKQPFVSDRSIRSASSGELMPSMNIPNVCQDGFPAPKLALEQSKDKQSRENTRGYDFTDRWVICGVSFFLIDKSSLRRAQISSSFAFF